MLATHNIEALYNYAQKHSKPQSQLLDALERETYLQHQQPHMLSGHLQGQFLSLISSLLQPKCILEIGTYTGYSALCLAQGLAPNGILHTLELDAEKEAICKKYFEQSAYATQINLHIGNALDIIKSLNITPQLVFIDADKTNYINYYNAIINMVPSGGLIIADNVLFHAQVLDEVKSKNAHAVHDYNLMLQQDNRAEVLILPLRDGLSIARKK